MNRTALSVIALAVGAVLIIGLFNVYKPQISNTTHDVFDKVRIGRMAGTKGPSIDQQARDHHINPDNPNRPDQIGLDPVTYYGHNQRISYDRWGNMQGGRYVIVEQPWTYTWHKNESKGFIGYWKPKKQNTEITSDQDYGLVAEHQGDASYIYYEKPNGSVVQGRWNSNEA